MWYIIIAILALGIVSAVVGLYYNRKFQRMLKNGEISEIPEAKEITAETECCGQHETCEKDSLLAAVSKSIEYYEDEELDRFKHKGGDEYTDDEVDEFREVLYTLKEDEVAGWLRSLLLREIELPDDLKDEAFLIVGERRIH